MPENVDCFRVRVVEDGGIVTVSIEGELDLATAPQLEDHLHAIVAGAPQIVVIDTAGVPFVDSAGIAAVVKAYRDLRAGGGELQLGPMSKPVERVFEVAGLLDQLPRSGNGTRDR